MECPCVHQEVVTFERSQAYPEYTLTDLSESHGASQIEIRLLGNTNNASLQRGRDFPVASTGRSEKGAVPGQKDGKDRGEGRKCSQAHRKS